MIVTESIAALEGALARPATSGLVPTMGALHAGHRALLDAARAGSERVVMSLFVNPSQFGAGEDLERYPRPLEADLAIAGAAGVDVVFAPAASEIYPPGFATTVDPGPLARELCGASRPGHFAAVATIVTKLFGLVRPQTAYFGAKDYQQLTIVRRTARDLSLAVDVVGVPTVRDPDGLALSSRNVFLSAAERTQALTLSAGVRASEAAYGAGERAAAALLGACRAELVVEPEYLELRDRELGPYLPDRPAVLLVASRFATTRLIDNTLLGGTP